MQKKIITVLRFGLLMFIVFAVFSSQSARSEENLLTYIPVTPCKIVDTRNTSEGIIDTSTVRDFHVYGDGGTIDLQGGNPTGCPSPLGEPSAVHISLATVDPTGKGNLKAFPVGASPDAGLTVNFASIGTNINNAGTVMTNVGTGPDISLSAQYAGTHATVQVLGYYYPNGDLLYTPVTPCKIVDTRTTSEGIIGGPTEQNFHVYGDGGTIGLQGGNPAGCPSPLGDPRAVHISMAAVDPTGKGNLKAFPVGTPPDAGLTVNFASIGTNINNAGTVMTTFGVGADISLFAQYADTHATVQVLGYYYSNGDFAYTPVTPCKIVDTRNTSEGIIDTSTVRDFHVYGDGGIIGLQGGNPAGCSSPLGDPRAVHISVAAVDPTGKGNLKAFPVGAPPDAGLTVNFASIGTNLNNAGSVMTSVGTGPDISLSAQYADTHATVQVLGYYYPISSLRIMQPIRFSLQTSTDIHVVTNVYTIEDLYSIDSNGAGIKFVLDGGLGNGGDEYEDLEAPFETTFSDVMKMEHTVRAVVIDNSGMEINGFTTEHQVNNVGVGDYYVAFGDSITDGYADDIPLDDISQDLRNVGGGYPPVLNDLLTADKGYPHTVLNEGVGGEESIDGAARIQSVIDAHPDAQYFLVLFGTNDSSPSMPVPSGVGPGPPAPGTFEYNMQQIIDIINPVVTGKIPILAKVPMRFGDWTSSIPYSDPESHPKNLLIEEYNAVIDELKSLNPMIEVMTGPPDQSDNFFTYFRDLPRQDGLPIEFADFLHPNGIGYQSMADLWFETLTE